jgi:hypothetical protein
LRENHQDPVTLALAALAATLGDARRAQRFLNLTGIGTEELRERAEDPALLSALLGFLEANEPDLLSVSVELGISPIELLEAHRTIDEGMP